MFNAKKSVDNQLFFENDSAATNTNGKIDWKKHIASIAFAILVSIVLIFVALVIYFKKPKEVEKRENNLDYTAPVITSNIANSIGAIPPAS